MKAPLGLTLCLLAHLLIEVACNDGGFNIHGGYFDVYNADSSRKLETRYRWGAWRSKSNRRVIGGAQGFCWRGGNAYGYLKLVVSRTNQPNEEHYQIVGSNMIIKDIRSRYEVQNYGWGVREEVYGGVQDVLVAAGFIWSTRLKTWGYGYLHLFVKRTTRPSLTDAFLFEKRNAGTESRVDSRSWVGQKSYGSNHHKLSDFKSWTRIWGERTIGRWTIYTALTKLVDSTPIYEEMTVEPMESSVLKSLTLENNGTGVTSDQLAIIGTSETVTLLTKTKIESKLDFSVDEGSRVSIDVSFVRAPFDINLHFGYPSTDTRTMTTTSTIEWPSQCPPGIRMVIVVSKITEDHSVPIEFTFERIGERFSERKTLEATVNKLDQQSTSCCLFESASQQCGSQSLPMC